MLRLLTLIVMFAVITVKAQVVAQTNNDPIDANDSTLTVSAADFESTCKICNYDSNCLKIKYDNKYVKVVGSLFLDNTPIISLGKLLSVSRNLLIDNTRIQSLGNLKLVGGNLFIANTQLSKSYSEKQIRNILKVTGKINGCENIETINDSIAETSYLEVVPNMPTTLEQNDITLINDSITETSYNEVLANTPTNVDQNEITVSSEDFLTKCIICSNNINCVNQKYNNKDIIIDGDLNLSLYSNIYSIETLGNIKYIKGSLDLHQTNVKSLGKLEHVEGSLSLSGHLQSFENLFWVGGDLHIDTYSPISKQFTKKQIKELIHVLGIITGIPEIKPNIPPELFIKLWGPNQTNQIWYGVDDPSINRYKNYYSSTRVVFTRTFRSREPGEISIYNGDIPVDYIVGITTSDERLSFDDYYTVEVNSTDPNTMKLIDKEGNDCEFWITHENSKFHLYMLTSGPTPEFNLILKPINVSKNKPIVPKRHK